MPKEQQILNRQPCSYHLISGPSGGAVFTQVPTLPLPIQRPRNGCFLPRPHALLPLLGGGP